MQKLNGIFKKFSVGGGFGVDELDLSAAADMIKDLLSDDEGKQQIQNIMSVLTGEKK